MLFNHCFFFLFFFWGTHTEMLPHMHFIQTDPSCTPQPSLLQSCLSVGSRNSVLCRLVELLWLLLFYLSLCWSECEVGGHAFYALCVKVSELQMKLCRSDVCQRLTANFHQSSYRARGGMNHSVPRGPMPLWGSSMTPHPCLLSLWTRPCGLLKYRMRQPCKGCSSPKMPPHKIRL